MKLPTATISTTPQGTPEWLAERRGVITASRFSAILTPSGKLSAQAGSLARKLARECHMDDPQEFEGNRFTRWGNEHEPEARWQWEEHHGVAVTTVGLCRNTANPALGCSPDGLIADATGEFASGLEIKCPAIDTLVGWMLDLRDKVPPEYMPQVHGSMIVTGLRRWEFCGYHPGAPLYLATARWDSYTDALAKALDGFTARYRGIHALVTKALGKGDA